MSRINAHLAHDMRTPLQLIYSCAQMIQTELDNPNAPAGRYARMLMENVESLREMVALELDASEHFCDIVEITSSLCRRMDIQAGAKGAVLLFSTNTAAFKTRLDSRKYSRILQNLISNAIRFTPQGGSIRVDLRAMGDTVEISVSDTGPGIDTAKQKRLFDRGESLDSYGLGLNIVRKFTRQLGGRIDVRSTPGKGAAFILRLPVRGMAV